MLAWLRERGGESATLATPVDALATQLNLAVARFGDALNPGVLGYLEPGEPLIFLRADLPEPMRRFTLAHEIGHAALHRSIGLAVEVAAAGGGQPEESVECVADDLQAISVEDEALAPGQAYSARAQREAEANAFAAALLLPADAALATYRSLCAADTPHPALELGRQFGVSEEVALRRLAALLTELQQPEQPEDSREDASAQTASATQHDTASGENSASNSDSSDSLDDSQRRAVEAPAPALVVAGPGSGKTRALVARARYLVEQRGVAPERILALTYSRKAAGELGERMRQALGAGASPWIGTIHSFCGDLLRRFGAQVGVRPDFHLVTDVEGYTILRRVLVTVPLVEVAPIANPESNLRTLHDQIGRAKDALISPAAYRLAAEQAMKDAASPGERKAAAMAVEVAAAYQAYQDALEARGDADYGDLIWRAGQALREIPEARESLRARFNHLLVDEYQDINYAMAVALREMAGPDRAIWAVGDADQAIYRFRGASPENLRRFERDFAGGQTIALTGNYRSHPDIVRAATAFAKSELPGEERLLLAMRQTGAGEGHAVTLAVAADEEAELDGLAATLRAHAARGVPLASQAILLRTRRQGERFARGLLARGVPTQTPLPLFERPFSKDILAALSLTVDPLSAALLRPSALPEPLPSATDIRALIALASAQGQSPLDAARERAPLLGVSPAGRASLRHLVSLVDELRAAPSIATGMSRYLFSLTSLGMRLLEGDLTGERATAARLLEIARAFDDTFGRGDRASSSGPGPAHADWVGFIDYVRIMITLRDNAGASTLDSGGDAVRVLTVHGSKGLEFPVVYVPRLAKGEFPSTRRPSHTEIHPPAGLRSPAGEPLEQSGEMEEANLFYVAMTRARDALILSRPERSGSKRSNPSAFLAPIEQALGADLRREKWARATDTGGADERPDGAEERLQTEAPHRIYSLSELQSYSRCPQRYAYEYGDGLRPKPSPLSDYGDTLGEAVADLHARWPKGISREEAQALFDARWAQRRGALARDEEPADATTDAHAAVLARYGRRMMERLWLALTTGPAKRGDDDATEVAPETLANGESQRFTVRVGEIEIDGSVIIHTDAHAPGDAPAERAQNATQAGEQPGARTIWLAQRRASIAAAPELDVRDLFHALVAEGLAVDGVTPEVVRVRLTSGVREPVALKAQTRATLEAKAQAAAEGIARRHFDPNPSERTCQGCPFVLICPA